MNIFEQYQIFDPKCKTMFLHSVAFKSNAITKNFPEYIIGQFKLDFCLDNVDTVHFQKMCQKIHRVSFFLKSVNENPDNYSFFVYKLYQQEIKPHRNYFSLILFL